MEDQLVTFVNEYLATCTGKPTILKAIRDKYHVHFNAFGLGKYGEWLNRNKHRLNIDDAKARATVIGLKTKVPEAELLLFIRDSIKRNGCLNYALSELRGKYGDGDFARFGYGTFVAFTAKYNLKRG